jgi:asparagine synthase (glutamine-hydrolysing)
VYKRQAHSLESRVPFLDNDLVDFAMALPLNLKLRNLGDANRVDENDIFQKMGKSSSAEIDGKVILRKVMERHIPSRVTQARKQGFSAPDASWFKGDSVGYVTRKLLQNDSRIYQVLDEKFIKSLVVEHFEGKVNRRLLIWSLLSLDESLSHFD